MGRGTMMWYSQISPKSAKKGRQQISYHTKMLIVYNAVSTSCLLYFIEQDHHTMQKL